MTQHVLVLHTIIGTEIELADDSTLDACSSVGYHLKIVAP